MQRAGQWWNGTSLAANLRNSAKNLNKTWKNSNIGKTVAAVTAGVNKAATTVKEKWNNSNIGKFCNRAATSVNTFYQKHKTAINTVAGIVVIGACAAATVATGGIAACTLAGAASQGALAGSLALGASGAVGGAYNSAKDYMKENGTIDGSTSKVLEGASTGFAVGTITGAATGAYAGASAYKKDPGKFCFVAGTLVLTAAGLMCIQDIRVGDQVYAMETETGEMDYQTVLDTYINDTEELYTVTIDGEEIQATAEHPFYTTEEGWVAAKDLEEGDHVPTADGEEATVEKIEREELDEAVEVYNFNVMDYHTYYVGENGVLVHNKCNTPESPAGESGNNSKLKDVFDLADSYNLNDDTFNNHILDRHGPNSLYNNKSHFNAEFDIKNAIDSTLRGDNFTIKSNTVGRAGYIFEQIFSNPIGTNSKGNPLYTIKVVIDEFGNVVTAFPKK